MDRLRAKLASITASHGVCLDDTTSLDLHQIMEVEQQVVHRFPRGSFQQIFWQQQKESACRFGKDEQGMHWHPFMMKWCLCRCHQSSKAYEMIRESNRSGPSVDASCPLDIYPVQNGTNLWLYSSMRCTSGVWQAYRKQDWVHQPRWCQQSPVGFWAFNCIEQRRRGCACKVHDGLHGQRLVHSTQVAYIQFPCYRVTDDLLFHPLWQAVYHLQSGWGWRWVDTYNSHAVQAPACMSVWLLGAGSNLWWCIGC